MLTHLLFRHANTQPDAPFLAFEDQCHSYGEMAGKVLAYTRHLQTLGVKPGDHVAVLCGNRPEFLLVWFAINAAGAVAVPVNVNLVGEGLHYTLRQSEARLLLVDVEHFANAPDIVDALRQLLPIAAIPSINAVCASAADPLQSCQPAVDPLAANSILYTSGTTGLPKGVVLSHQTYLCAGRDMAASLDMTPTDRVMVFLPLFHANPQMYAVASVLTTGATLVLLRRFSASQFFNEAKRHRATGFTFVGTVLSILEKTHPGQQRDHSLRWGVGGGAPKRVWEAVQDRFGTRINELYGMTETGGWVTMNTRDHARLGSVGLPRQHVRIAICAADGQKAAAGQRGEIIAQSSVSGMFFSEYWKNPEATAATLKNGWLHTGDRGFMDAQGFLYFDGRLKDLIRRGGEMIAPAEIEQQILKMEGIQDCAVVGVPDDVWGEELKAFIVGKAHIAPENIRSFLKNQIPDYMVPNLYAYVDAIPKTETQKVKRHELLSMHMRALDEPQSL